MDSIKSTNFIRSVNYSFSSTAINCSQQLSNISHSTSSLTSTLVIDNVRNTLNIYQKNSTIWKQIYGKLTNFMLCFCRIAFYFTIMLILSNICFLVDTTEALIVDKRLLQYPLVQPVALLESPLKSRLKNIQRRASKDIKHDISPPTTGNISTVVEKFKINSYYGNLTANSNSTNLLTTIQSPDAIPTSVLNSSEYVITTPPTSTILPKNKTDWTESIPAQVSLSTPQPTLSPKNEFAMPAFQTILITIALLCVIIGTIIGNILVCIAVAMVRKLRRPSNYLLVSLALSDLCVAILVMPMAMLYEILQKWNFSSLLCDIWVSFDVLSCTASILNLCAISVDRYFAITKPLEYAVRRTPRHMTLCVAMVWLSAACISLPPLLILGNEHTDENGEPTCSVCQNSTYQIYATLGSFYIPLAVMLFVYYQIFRAARRIALDEKRTQTHLQNTFNVLVASNNQSLQIASPPSHMTHDQHRHSSCDNTSSNFSACGGLDTSHNIVGGKSRGSGSSGLLGPPHQKKVRFHLANEKKASTTLGIIMSAFIICWLPFFILALIRPFVESETIHVPPMLSSIFLWLGYTNSLLNPIIYATLNRDFRKPFKEILFFRCSSLKAMMRENNYQDQYGEPPSQRVILGEEKHGRRESFL